MALRAKPITTKTWIPNKAASETMTTLGEEKDWQMHITSMTQNQDQLGISPQTIWRVLCMCVCERELFQKVFVSTLEK